jgi:hypothetical protein
MQQILEGFMSFIGMLICTCSDIVVYFTISLSLVLSIVTVTCLLYIFFSFFTYITDFIINK